MGRSPIPGGVIPGRGNVRRGLHSSVGRVAYSLEDTLGLSARQTADSIHRTTEFR